MQAKNIIPIISNSDAQVQYGTVLTIDKLGYKVQGQTNHYLASRAFSCMVEPIPGDKVMFSTQGALSHILSIIERPDSVETLLSFPGDVFLNTEQGQLSLNGKRGINISSQKNITQVSEEYSLITKKAFFSIDSLNAVGSKLMSKFGNIQTYSDSIETVSENLLQKLKNSFRLIEGVDQSQSRDVINTVENMYCMRSKQAAILAEKDIKVDAERIHMG